MVEIATYGAQALEVIKLVFFTLLILGSTGIGLWLFLKEKKYSQYKCIIWEKDTFGNIIEKTDRAGVFVDKQTRNKRLFLRKNNVGLDPDQIPFVPKIGGRFGAKRVVYLFQTGLKNFQFIIPKVQMHMEENEQGEMVEQTNISLQVGEEDVNWAVNAYERQKKLTQNIWLQQLLPYIGLMILFLGIVAVSYFLMQKFEVIESAAQLLNEAADKIAAASSGTNIVQ